MGVMSPVSVIIIHNFVWPGVRLVLFVNKLGFHLQVTGAFVIWATLLLKVYLQGMEQKIDHTSQVGYYIFVPFTITSANWVRTYECIANAPHHTSLFLDTSCNGLKIGKESRFCRERLDLAFCSTIDMPREKTTGSSLSLTGACRTIWNSYINLCHARTWWLCTSTSSAKPIAKSIAVNSNDWVIEYWLQTHYGGNLPLQPVPDFDTWFWKMVGSGGQCNCQCYCPESELEGFLFSQHRPQLCISTLYQEDKCTVNYGT